MGVPTLELRTGRGIPAVGFGTGTSFFNRGDDVEIVVRQAYQAGFRSFDCATIYGTEEGLGRGLSNLGVRRENLFITTKTPDWAWTQEKIEDEVRKSLKRLQLEYVDLVLLHTPAPRTESALVSKIMCTEDMSGVPDPQDAEQMDQCRLQAWLGLQNCVTKGLVRDIGVSNFNVNHLTKLIRHSEVSILPAINQVEFNPYLVDTPLYQYCKDNGILLQAFAPLGNGKDLLGDPGLLDIAKELNKTPAQIALRWAWQLGIPVVTKTENEGRMKENLDYFDINLSPHQMDRISGLNKNERRFGDPARFP